LRKQPERRFQNMADLKVALEEITDESQSGALAGAQVSHLRRGPARVGVAGAMVVLLVVGAAWWFFGLRQTDISAPSTPYPLTTYPGTEEEASVSPDGNQVAFSGNVEAQDNFDIYVKSIGSESALRVTRDPRPDTWPKWSPDGRWIAFEREGRLLITSPFGGSERVIADGIRLPHGWTPDSQFVIVSTGDAFGASVSLVAISVADGERKEIVSSVAAGFAFISASGSMLGWSRQSTLSIAPLGKDLRAGPAKRLQVANAADIEGCAWTASNRNLICMVRSSHRNRPPSLWRIDVEDPSKPVLLPMTDGASDPSLSVRGDRLVFDEFSVERDMWRAPNPDVNRKMNAPERFLNSTVDDGTPQYSPDGRLIAFVSSRSGMDGIWIAEADGTKPRMAVSMPGIDGSIRWAPGSESVVFSAKGQIHTLHVDAGPAAHVAPKPPITGSGCSYSADGRSLYCGSDGRIFKMPLEGGPWREVAAGHWPVESPDGQFLFFTRGRSILRKDLARGTEEELVEANSMRDAGFGRLPEFVLAKGGFYFLKFDLPDAPGQIWFYDFKSAKSREVLRFPKAQRFTDNGFSLSPDRQWFLFTLMNFQDDLYAVDHFQ
jgi:Tol biopolymer transport system component